VTWARNSFLEDRILVTKSPLNPGQLKPLDGAISAVANCRDAMLEAIDDTGTWGPAKAFVAAAQSGGVDLSDSDAVERFTVVYNEQLGAR
jgi:hypothetical protein